MKHSESGYSSMRRKKIAVSRLSPDNLPIDIRCQVKLELNNLTRKNRVHYFDIPVT